MEQEPPPTPSAPPISASKQDRILIWRNEVASASYSSSTRSAPSLITTTTSSSASVSPSELAALPRHSRFWHRIKTRISGRLRRRSSAASGEEHPDFMNPPRKDDVVRTSMYRNLRLGEPASPTEAALAAADAAAADGEEVIPGEESNGDRKGGLLAKQERLERASRLLNRAP